MNPEPKIERRVPPSYVGHTQPSRGFSVLRHSVRLICVGFITCGPIAG